MLCEVQDEEDDVIYEHHRPEEPVGVERLRETLLVLVVEQSRPDGPSENVQDQHKAVAPRLVNEVEIVVEGGLHEVQGNSRHFHER